jgi:hypothetical protein
MKPSLTEFVELLISAADEQNLTIGDLFLISGSRGLAVLLLLPSLLLLMPFGFFPGSSTILGVIVLIISTYMMLGRTSVPLPKRISRISLPGDKLKPGLARMLPLSLWIDNWLGRRLVKVADNKYIVQFSGAVVALQALLIIVVGIIPGVPTILSFIMLMTALGLIVHDGLVLVLAHTGFLGTIIVLIIVLL